MDNLKPRISVIMSAFNTEKYIGETIESILNQTFEDFEFIILDDGSTDDTPSIIKRYSNQDSRIRFISNSKRGIIANLNEGILMSQAEFIAIMESDDISLPERFRYEYEFLIQHPEVMIVGTRGKYIDEKGEITGDMNPPITEGDIMNCVSELCHPFITPSIMIRKSLFMKLGRIFENDFFQDLDLSTNAGLKGFKLANIDEILIHYRRHSQNSSKKRKYWLGRKVMMYRIKTAAKFRIMTIGLFIRIVGNTSLEFFLPESMKNYLIRIYQKIKPV